MRSILIITSFCFLAACGGVSDDTSNPATSGISTPGNVSAIPSQ